MGKCLNDRCLQTMSMRCGMVPMMFPGVQQYVPPMAMAMGMGTGPSMPNPVASAVTVAAQLGRRFPVPRFNLSCNAIFEWNLVENAYHESKNLKKEMKTMEASLLRSAKKTQLSYEKTDILTTLFHLLFISFLLY
ncbi:transcription factor PIF1-like protein isoform X1 [Tanacetum coccineum]